MAKRARMVHKDLNAPKKPDWIRAKSSMTSEFIETQNIVKKNNLSTVCQEAMCPNIGECWAQKHATVMILGAICTRACKFCNVATGRPEPLDPQEPQKTANLAKAMNLSHIVITSVDRDDLEDGGANQFANCIKEVRRKSPNTSIEVLTPDFLGKEGAMEIVVKAKPDVYNHNLETVARLYKNIKPKANYFNSLNLLWKIKEIDKDIFTKSGLIVGLGETKEEIIGAMEDLRSAKVDFLTIGQYLQPTPFHLPIDRFVTPNEFAEYQEIALKKGFLFVASSPMTRSSYHAGSDFQALLEAKSKKPSTKA